ncbi:hypothetical protein JVU11DRAFT_3134 [Chiua virens]|nr:hypothetical protein JVU11DRAFT_3134 [Chiua virens]
MPHKRATRSVREQRKAQRATDLPPHIAIEHEPVPKSVSRVLDAGRIRREYRKKRQLDPSGADGHPQKKRCHDATSVKDDEIMALRIKPNETIAQFNRRVENNMMPLVKTSLRQSSSQTRSVRREEAAEEIFKRGIGKNKSRHPLPESSKMGSDPPLNAVADEETPSPRNKTKEFQAVSTAAPRRLNDIAQEPPVIMKLPRGATKNDAAPSGVLSMAQKAMMEGERDKAIKHYRELKARKLRGTSGV